MLKREGKGIYFNTDSGHYELRFTHKNLTTGQKTRPHIVAQIKLEDGTIRYAQTKEEAKLAISQYIANGGSIEKVILKENKSLLSDCIKEYILHCQMLGKARTDLIETYCNYFYNYLNNKNITVGEICTNDFYRYMAYRQKCKIMTKTKQGEKWTGRYVSNATINREMNSIKGLFRYLKRVVKVIKENPCEDIGTLPIEEKTKMPPTQEQENQIMELASEDYMFFVMIVMFDTLGNRRGEINNLLWENVHLESSNLFPFGYVDFVKRKNNKNLRLPLSEELQILLQNLPKMSEYVFTNPKTGTKYNSRLKKLKAIFKKVGLEGFGIGFHIFRHNTAAKLEQNGVEVSTIKDILGNSTNVVLSTYLNQGIKRKQEVINLNSERIKKYVKRCEFEKNVQEMSKNEKVIA